MNDAEAEQQKARILAIVARWKDALGLGWWDIVYSYHRGGIPDYEDAIATCVPRWRYQHAHIQFNLCKVADQSDEELEKVVLHEYGHLFLSIVRPITDMTDEDLDREELGATVLARTWRWTRGHFEEKEFVHVD